MAPISRTNTACSRGVGKVSKNVRMKDLKEVNTEALRYYIKQALVADAQRPGL